MTQITSGIIWNKLKGESSPEEVFKEIEKPPSVSDVLQTIIDDHVFELSHSLKSSEKESKLLIEVTRDEIDMDQVTKCLIDIYHYKIKHEDIRLVQFKGK